ncbi:MAG TPA: flagellar basal body rod protein FlgC [Kofleriaceae bacterium]|nr:flagellar basal body rod protein FlgC [Kofleriaceae bacterium]
MDFFTAMEVSASGLSAQRVRMNVSASNLANVDTTQAVGGGPYKKKSVVVESVPFGQQMGVNGVAVKQIVSDTSAPRMEYDPESVDADANGYVAYPNINPVEEMVDMITASRAYEAGVTALSTSVSMAERALGIGH